MDVTQPTHLPVACTLTAEAIQARRAGLLPGLVQRADGVEHLQTGLRLRFSASSEVLRAIANVIDAERQCCRFLQFELMIEPDGGPIALTITGPPGTADFLDALIRE
jgi:hypothetical protein